MTKVSSFKMPFETTHFNKNQIVWVVFSTGSQAAYCYGRFRGIGRHVRAWVGWKGGEPPVIKEFEVEDDFASRILGT